MTSMTHVLSLSPATTSYSSPIAAWSSTFVQASVKASSMSVRQSRSTPRVCSELFSTRRTTGTLTASRGSCSVNLISTTETPSSSRGIPAGKGCLTDRSVRQANGVVLDDGVGQQRPGHLLGGRGRVVGVEVELEVLALTHLSDAVEPETRERPLDRLPLRVEDLGLRHHVDDDLHHSGTLSATGRS